MSATFGQVVPLLYFLTEGLTVPRSAAVFNAFSSLQLLVHWDLSDEHQTEHLTTEIDNVFNAQEKPNTEIDVYKMPRGIR